jgi:molybdenum cofactor synthesis domain-containing protein
VAGKGFKRLTPTSEALKLAVSKLQPRTATLEKLPLCEALGRILGEDLIAPTDIPPFDRAAMDGFAVKAEDTYGASTVSPILLKSVGSIRIGVQPSLTLAKGQAVSVVTGSQMPQGANAVVMVEYTKRTSDAKTIEVSEEVHPSENVARTGEDVRKGALVLKRGTRLLPQDVGMLYYLGISTVSVKRPLKIAVLSTGNELQEGPGIELGKMPDVNRPMLVSAIKQLNCEPVDMGVAPDEFEEIQDRLKKAIEIADMVLVTAGTSVGPEDIVPNAINSFGKPGMLVHGVAMRPSMPTGLGVVNGKPIISLPGYPASAYLAFLEFVPPLIDHILETGSLPKPTVKAILQRRVAGVLGSRTYVRVLVTDGAGGTFADPVRTSGAGILSSLVQANGFIIVPEHVEGYEERQTVDVQLFRPLEREHPVK